MKNKTFLINFNALVTMSGHVNIKAETEEEALMLAKLVIIRNLESEDCLIELDEKGDLVTVREMELIKTRQNDGYSITNIMPLN